MFAPARLSHTGHRSKSAPRALCTRSNASHPAAAPGAFAVHGNRSVRACPGRFAALWRLGLRGPNRSQADLCFGGPRTHRSATNRRNLHAANPHLPDRPPRLRRKRLGHRPRAGRGSRRARRPRRQGDPAAHEPGQHPRHLHRVHAVRVHARPRPTRQLRGIRECSGTWPPYTTKRPPRGRPGVRASLLSSIKIAGGKTQVTYAGHPLYLYSGDSGPGETSYVGESAFGGRWYALNGSGGDRAVAGRYTTAIRRRHEVAVGLSTYPPARGHRAGAMVCRG